jgi:hypothetical protein
MLSYGFQWKKRSCGDKSKAKEAEMLKTVMKKKLEEAKCQWLRGN